mgnify:CR=1 FL=1
MDHQDWNNITFTNNADKKKKQDTAKKISQLRPDENMKMEAPSKLGQLICQGRTTKNKNQKQLAADLGISSQVLARWESNKEVPNNADIAKIERALGVKLPRVKKVKSKIDE